MFKLFPLIFLLIILIVASVYGATIITATIWNLDDFLSLYFYFLAVFILLFSVTDLVLHYIVRSNKFNLDPDFKLVLDNFSYTRKNKRIQIFTSRICPDLLCLGLFNSTVLILNDAIFKRLSPREIRVLIEYELQYSNCLGSKLEQVLKRFYLLSYYPLKWVMSLCLPRVLSSYLLSPFVLFYLFAIKTCRNSFKFSGKNEEMINQISFKLKTLEVDKVLELFSSFISFINLSVSKNRDEQLVSRFSRNEILKW